MADSLDDTFVAAIPPSAFGLSSDDGGGGDLGTFLPPHLDSNDSLEICLRRRFHFLPPPPPSAPLPPPTTRAQHFFDVVRNWSRADTRWLALRPAVWALTLSFLLLSGVLFLLRKSAQIVVNCFLGNRLGGRYGPDAWWAWARAKWESGQVAWARHEQQGTLDNLMQYKFICQRCSIFWLAIGVGALFYWFVLSPSDVYTGPLSVPTFATSEHFNFSAPNEAWSCDGIVHRSGQLQVLAKHFVENKGQPCVCSPMLGSHTQYIGLRNATGGTDHLFNPVLDVEWAGLLPNGTTVALTKSIVEESQSHLFPNKGSVEKVRANAVKLTHLDGECNKRALFLFDEFAWCSLTCLDLLRGRSIYQ